MGLTILQKIKKYGFGAGFRYINSKVFHTEIVKAHYLVLETDIVAIDKKLMGFDIDVKELTYEDFLKGDSVVFNKAKLKAYERRCQDPTYKAYGIFEDDKLVYSTWVSTHRMGMSVETQPVFLMPNEGYLEDSYCAPEARGKGYHSKMNLFRIKKLFEMGKTRVIAIVQEGNTPALKVQFKSGLKEIGHFYHGRFLGRKFNTLKKDVFDNIK